MLDWRSIVLKILNKQIPNFNYNKIRNAMKYDIYFPDLVENCYEILEQNADYLWNNIEPFEWSEDLLKLSKSYLNTKFLSSPGSSKKSYHTSSKKGKLIALPKYFPNTDIIFERKKEIHANPNCILIDDTKKKVKAFQDNGGSGFLWPNQYKLIDGEINIHQTLGELERNLENLANNI